LFKHFLFYHIWLLVEMLSQKLQKSFLNAKCPAIGYNGSGIGEEGTFEKRQLGFSTKAK